MCVCVCLRSASHQAVLRDKYVRGQHQPYQYYFHKLSEERIVICLPCWKLSLQAVVKMHFASVQAGPGRQSVTRQPLAFKFVHLICTKSVNDDTHSKLRPVFPVT